MKITAIIHSLSGGGAERVMAGLVNRLQQRGHSCTLITLDDGQRDRHDLDASVQRMPLNVMSDRRGLWDAVRGTTTRVRTLRQAIVASGPDVVLSFCDRTNLLTLMATARTQVPVVVSERSDPAMQVLPFPWRQVRPMLYRRATTVIALTATSARVLAPWCRREPLVIPSAVDAPPQVAVSQHEPSRSVMLAVGRLEYEKGFDRLVGAFSTIAAQFPNWRLRIVGEGSQRSRLQQQIAELGLYERVELPGWKRPIWPEYAMAQMFVLPSRYEGFPSALLEAMAAGLPCIAVDCESGPREIIRTGVDGWLVKDSESAIAEGIGEAIQNESMRRRFAESAKSVVQRFGWDSMVDAYESVLETASGRC